ncbi:MAG: hypothetical protein ACKVQC_00635 [Elusimicrobiota bacterium]
MTKKLFWGLWLPLLGAFLFVLAVFIVKPSPSVRAGLFLGLLIAFVQAALSTGAMVWAWNKKSFYWVWMSGFLFRLLVFSITAYFVFQSQRFHVVATLLTLVMATMFFMVIESRVFWELKKAA